MSKNKAKSSNSIVKEASQIATPGSALEQASPSEQTVDYSVSPGFPGLMARLNMSLALTSYQSGRFYLLGLNPQGGLMINERLFAKAMGLCVEGNALILATLFQIQRFENVLQKGQFINHTHDACYVPRLTYTTGVLDAHDVGILENGEIIFVSTRYNCLAVPSTRDSFTPAWKPPFISQIIDEDRCHLNGLAMEKGRPRYVTAVSKSDTIDGWRDRRADGGVIIDVETNEIVCSGLSMPHSPRIYKDQLWVLNSGTGELGRVDVKTGTFNPLTFCPGFARGLSFHDKYAFVGLSKPRYKRFEGLALDEKLQKADSEPWCGVQVIDLETGTCGEWFRIDGAISEIYDVAVVKGVNCPMSLGFASDEIRGFIVPGQLDATKIGLPLNKMDLP